MIKIASGIVIDCSGVFLRLVRRDDVFGPWWTWLNDPQVTQLMDKGYGPNTPEKQLEFFDKINASEKDLVFAICDQLSRSHVGTVGLHDIDHIQKSAQFGIIIGENSHRGRGIGASVWNQVMRYGFEDLQLSVIRTMIVPDNFACVHIALKLGFVERDCQKGAIIKGNKRYDYMALTLNRVDWRPLEEKRD